MDNILILTIRRFLISFVNGNVYYSCISEPIHHLLTGIAMYLCHKNLKKEVLAFVTVSLVWVLITIVLSKLSIHDLMFKYIEWMEIFAAPLMLCYNGQRGKGSKYLFYVFYPTHIYLLYALSVIFYR